MKTIQKILFLTVLIHSILFASAQDAKTILANMDKIMFSAKDRSGKVTIILTEKDGSEKVIREKQIGPIHIREEENVNKKK